MASEMDMTRAPIPTWCFALTVVLKDDRFLLVHERKHGELWYLPAGRVEPGETFESAAIRETFEESGVRVSLRGIVRIEHTPGREWSRLRVIFLADPLDDATPKSVPDAETLGAAWVRLADLARYPLRGPEVEDLFRHVASGGAVFPLDLLRREGAPY